MMDGQRKFRPGPVVFLHVPKTAGTSVIDGLQRMKCWAGTMTESGHITAELLAQAASRPAGTAAKTLVFGHAYHQIMPGLRNSTLLTVLREPEEHAVSNYLHMRRHAETHLHAQANQLGFADFMRENWHYLVFQNIAVNVPSSNGPPPTMEEFFARVPFTQTMLDRIDYVGTTDNLKSFIKTVARAFGTRPPRLQNLNRSSEYGATAGQISELRLAYRALGDDPALAPLIAQERALFTAAKIRAAPQHVPTHRTRRIFNAGLRLVRAARPI